MKLSHSYSAIKQFEDCPLRYYRQRIVRDVKDTPGEASLYGTRVHEALEVRVGDGTPLPNDLAKHEPVCAKLAEHKDIEVERELVLTETLEPTTWWAPDAWLRSKLDVFLVRGKHALILDWKTGRRWIDMFQLKMFAAQTFVHYPEVKQVTVSLVWLKEGKVDTDVILREQYNDIMSDILSRINNIYDAYENANWVARPSKLCRYCPARHDCEYAEV